MPTLHQDSVLTPNGSIKLSTVFAGPFVDAIDYRAARDDSQGVFGWVLREAGKGKRSMKPMWINEKEASGETTAVFGDL